MSFGLQVFRADGSIDVDLPTETPHIVGVITVTSATTIPPPTITIPRASGEKCFVYILKRDTALLTRAFLVSNDGLSYDVNNNVLRYQVNVAGTPTIGDQIYYGTYV